MENVLSNKSKTALIIMDMQNGFIHEEGSLAKMGIPVGRASLPITPIKRLKQAFRENNMPVIYIMMTLSEDMTEGGVLLEVFPPLKPLGHCVKGSWDWKIVEELTPEPGDYVVEKFRFDSFHGTNLESLLRCMGIDTLVFSGIATNVCVESTVRSALTRDFKNIVITDATASFIPEMEAAAMVNFNFGFAKVTTTDEVISELNK